MGQKILDMRGTSFQREVNSCQFIPHIQDFDEIFEERVCIIIFLNAIFFSFGSAECSHFCRVPSNFRSPRNRIGASLIQNPLVRPGAVVSDTYCWIMNFQPTKAIISAARHFSVPLCQIHVLAPLHS